MIDLAGKRAFVTGGGRGIGRATAVLLARAGAAVAVGYRSRKRDADETVRIVGRSGGGPARSASRETWATPPPPGAPWAACSAPSVASTS